MAETEESCCICNKAVDTTESIATLTEKGCNGINEASEKRSSTLHAVKGQIVHKECRRLYCNPNVIARDAKIKENVPVRALRSETGAFSFKEHCLFCGQLAKSYGRKRGYEVYPVRTLDFQFKILDICEERQDKWADDIRARLEYAVDLPAVEAIYHQSCNVNFRTRKEIPQKFHSEHVKKTKGLSGRPSLQDTDQAFLNVIEYLKESDEVQITVLDLVEKMREFCGDQAFSSVHMKSKLEKHFGTSVIITEMNGKENVVTLRDTAESILHEFYKSSKSNNTESQKVKLIKAAAKLIKYDIKSIKSSKTSYPSSAEIASEEANKNFVPDSLKQFLGIIFSEKQSDVKMCSIGQVIIQAAIPRLTIAPLQIGLGVQLNHHFASKFLIDTLNNLGFCVSYSEVQMFEASAAISQGTDISNFIPGTFLQYAADNVDHNIRTLDGHNTFHGMGMIACLTPEIKCETVIPRQSVSTEDLVSAGKIEMKFFRGVDTSKLSASFAELQDLKVKDSSWKLSFLAQITHPLRSPGPEWSGFMQMVSRGEHPGKSSTVFLPMIDMDPSDMSCIYTTLTFVTNHAEKYNQTPVITFDQPLYWKALIIICSESKDSSLKNIVLRLGGFHCIMSFLGCIGQLMTGSGLKELLETVYAANAVPYILNGKAVARALRGHFLIDTALNVFFLSKHLGISIPENRSDGEMNDTENEIEKSDSDDVDINNNSSNDKEDDTSEAIVGSEKAHMQTLASMYENVLSGDVSVQSVNENALIDLYSNQMNKQKENMSKYPTAALWIQYMEMIKLLRQFLVAERTGNWKLSLQSLFEMLPYFAAAGHNLYLKSVYFYLQSMQSIQKYSPQVYEAFKSGHHVIRRSDRYWAGLSTDLVIEQVLMRSIKTTGGMTRGKGMTESQRAQWLFSMPSCAEINNAVQSFCGVEFHTSPQHKELGDARKGRDYKDTQTFLSFIAERNPFREDALPCNIETGVTSGESVNAYKAKEIGKLVINSMQGKDIFGYSFKKSQKAVTLDTSQGIRIENEVVKVDPQLLFQRLTAAAQRFVDDIPHVFSFELCNVPSSLFDMTGLIREPQKSILADSIWGLGDCSAQTTDLEIENGSAIHVLDGGSLIQRIPWTRGMLFSEICERYVQHVSNKYSDAIIVFDGYTSGPSIKDSAHIRRTHGVTSTKVFFTESTPFKTKKDLFLSNSENKQNFILMLGNVLEKKGYSVVHADGDADLLIVNTALDKAKDKTTIVIGEDTDILVLLLHHANSEHKQVYFRSDLKQRTSKGLRIWDIHQTRNLLGHTMCTILPVLHAITGCDSTSRLFGISKGNALKKFRSDSQMQVLAEVFLKVSTKEEIISSGEKLIVSLYGGLQIEGLDLLRFRKFSNKVMSSATYVQVYTLPPTSAATRYHSMRVYFQVQEWTNSDIAIVPQDWGWVEEQQKLMPIKTDLPAAPEQLLKMVRCKCKLHCDTKKCTCRKHGIECSSGCSECKGLSCTNVPSLTESDLSSDI